MNRETYNFTAPELKRPGFPSAEINVDEGCERPLQLLHR